METNKIIEASISSFLFDYKHHAYEFERNNLYKVLKGEASFSNLTVDLTTYKEVLGPDTIRAMKNSMISFITLFCRAAIDLGVPVEKSFSLSDFYINRIEECENSNSIQLALNEIIDTFRNQVAQTSIDSFSFHIRKSLKFIHANIYNNINVKDVSEHVKLDQKYFSKIFKKELKKTPIDYMQNLKIEEAKKLITSTPYSLKEISEILHFSSTAHFSSSFKKIIGLTPKQFKELQ
ncbi:hypothetical protein A4S06_08755 [Erysipelotrichaceae bacterium MTC7]|nr:hypothetical protein A4S06_08755 [Erysipelotrichaceae bacterium MTC7]